MIKFFRKIRKNLVSEGDTESYFKYAVGEIVLVVFGILIALQLNNLNESRKNKIFENKILVQIQENLKNDNEVLTEIEVNFKETISSANKILSSEVSWITKDSINFWLGTIIQFDRFQPLTNAYEVLKSSRLNQWDYDFGTKSLAELILSKVEGSSGFYSPHLDAQNEK